MHAPEPFDRAGGLPVAPSMSPTLSDAHVAPPHGQFDPRLLRVTGLALLLAGVAALVAQLLTRIIGLVTNAAFYGRFSTSFVDPAGHQLGAKVLVVPVIGGVLIGFMARYGSKAIRGHGIPEAMEQVLTNESRIPPRMTFLKPISAALSIGTGGPFGAEGPIIATGGALGSLVGQLLHTTASERKTLLAAGAAAGMSATFGSPVSAVVLAIELLLFEYRARSLVPVALAAATASAIRAAFVGTAPAFPLPVFGAPTGAAIALYVLVGAIMGVAAVLVTKAVYGIEDAFEKLPIHWMWWPALGGIAVGVVGLVEPLTMGVGYSNIENIVGGHFGVGLIATLTILKFVSWSISLGSGTSGGTLAPLFTIGGGLGALIGTGLAVLLPHAGVDPRMAALVGMAAMFAGASRALLASVVFAFETTHQTTGLLPLLGGCTAAYFVSLQLMRHSIMTERIARRGVRVTGEYAPDQLDAVTVLAYASPDVVTLAAERPIGEVRRWVASGEPGTSHNGYPVVDAAGRIVGVVTRRDLLSGSPDDAALKSVLHRAPVTVREDASLRDAVERMVQENIGRVPVVRADDPTRVVAMLTRSDVLAAYRRGFEAERRTSRTLQIQDLAPTIPGIGPAR